MTKKPKGSATKTHLTGRFQKGTTQFRLCVEPLVSLPIRGSILHSQAATHFRVGSKVELIGSCSRSVEAIQPGLFGPKKSSVSLGTFQVEGVRLRRTCERNR